MHGVYALVGTLAIILIGLLYNGSQIRELRQELRSDLTNLRGELSGRLDALHRDLMQIAREQGKHDARLDALEERQRP